MMDITRSILLVFAFFIGLVSNQPAYGQMPKIETAYSQQKEVKLTVLTLADFQKTVTLASSIHKGPLSEAQLSALIRTLKMVDEKNRPILRAAFDYGNGVLVGGANFKTYIGNSFITPDGKPAIVISTRDSKTGMPVIVNASDLSVVTTAGIKVPFKTKSFAKATAPMIVQILIDNSGSMSKDMERVKEATRQLLQLLPDHMRCGIISFGSEITDLNNGGYDACSPDRFALDKINASGGTPLFGALLQAYTKMNAPEFEKHQKAIIVLTDGDPGDIDTKLAALKAHNGISTIFFWLGDKSATAEADVDGLADHFVVSGEDAAKKLDQYFAAYVREIESQTVIILDQPASGKAP